MNNVPPEFYEAKVTVQLRDDTSGKLVQEEHGHNFAANQVIRYAKWLQRNQFKSGLTTIGATDSDYTPHSATSALVLTNSNLAEDPTNEWQMPGAMIGYSTKATYAGADIYRGSPNVAQLDARPAYTKWVFDWPTNAANGTTNSVGWVNSLYQDSTTTTGPYFFTQSSIEQTWATTNTWVYFARASATLAFGQIGSGTNISVLDSTYSQSSTFSVSGQFSAIRGIAWDSGNNFLWVIGDNAAARRIAAYNSTGVLQTGPFTLTTRAYRCLAYDGTSLWSITQNTNANHTAWKLSTANGSDISNFSFNAYARASNPTTYYNSVYGLCWDSTYSRLWMRTFSSDTFTLSTLMSFDTNGNPQTPDVSGYAWYPNTATSLYLAQSVGPTYVRDFDVIDGNQFAMPAYNNTAFANERVYRVRVDNMGTRSLLSSPVSKTNTQTLKVIYTINYV